MRNKNRSISIRASDQTLVAQTANRIVDILEKNGAEKIMIRFKETGGIYERRIVILNPPHKVNEALKNINIPDGVSIDMPYASI